jgi:hypothetical protein
MARICLDDPRYYFNRHESWLAFNRRVLEEAQDESNPLLERVKFLAITASNRCGSPDFCSRWNMGINLQVLTRCRWNNSSALPELTLARKLFSSITRRAERQRRTVRRSSALWNPLRANKRSPLSLDSARAVSHPSPPCYKIRTRFLLHEKSVD